MKLFYTCLTYAINYGEIISKMKFEIHQKFGSELKANVSCKQLSKTREVKITSMWWRESGLTAAAVLRHYEASRSERRGGIDVAA